MIGSSDEKVVESLKPALQAMGKNILLCGGVGNGQVAKMCNNLALAI